MRNEREAVGTKVVFNPTHVQRKALSLLKSGAKHILLFGGSRSGKTTVLVMAVRNCKKINCYILGEIE